MSFRRPGLFTDWRELAVWLSWPLALGAASIAALVIGPAIGRVVGAALLAATIGALVVKLGPRVGDLRHFAYRTRQGVGVVCRGVIPWPKDFVEDAIDRGIAAHVGANGCTRESLDGYGLLFVSFRFTVPGGKAGGVTDAGWMQVSVVPGDTTKATSEIVTHETARALLTEAGVPVTDQEAIMRERGTWWVVG